MEITQTQKQDKSLFDSLIELEDTKLSDERDVVFEDLRLDPETIKKNPLYSVCHEFWLYWIIKNKEQYQNLARGKHQFDNILNNDNQPQ